MNVGQLVKELHEENHQPTNFTNYPEIDIILERFTQFPRPEKGLAKLDGHIWDDLLMVLDENHAEYSRDAFLELKQAVERVRMEDIQLKFSDFRRWLIRSTKLSELSLVQKNRTLVAAVNITQEHPIYVYAQQDKDLDLMDFEFLWPFESLQAFKASQAYLDIQQEILTHFISYRPILYAEEHLNDLFVDFVKHSPERPGLYAFDEDKAIMKRFRRMYISVSMGLASRKPENQARAAEMEKVLECDIYVKVHQILDLPLRRWFIMNCHFLQDPFTSSPTHITTTAIAISSQGQTIQVAEQEHQVPSYQMDLGEFPWVFNEHDILVHDLEKVLPTYPSSTNPNHLDHVDFFGFDQLNLVLRYFIAAPREGNGTLRRVQMRLFTQLYHQTLTLENRQHFELLRALSLGQILLRFEQHSGQTIRYLRLIERLDRLALQPLYQVTDYQISPTWQIQKVISLETHDYKTYASFAHSPILASIIPELPLYRQLGDNRTLPDFSPNDFVNAAIQNALTTFQKAPSRELQFTRREYFIPRTIKNYIQKHPRANTFSMQTEYRALKPKESKVEYRHDKTENQIRQWVQIVRVIEADELYRRHFHIRNFALDPTGVVHNIANYKAMIPNDPDIWDYPFPMAIKNVKNEQDVTISDEIYVSLQDSGLRALTPYDAVNEIIEEFIRVPRTSFALLHTNDAFTDHNQLNLPREVFESFQSSFIRLKFKPQSRRWLISTRKVAFDYWNRIQHVVVAIHANGNRVFVHQELVAFNRDLTTMKEYKYTGPLPWPFDAKGNVLERQQWEGTQVVGKRTVVEAISSLFSTVPPIESI